MSFDVVVIGGGVNALTAASIMAKAGRKTAVVCPREQIGGLCARHEFHAGFFSPGILSDTSMFRRRIVDDLGLIDHGLTYSGSTKTAACGRDQQFVYSERTDETAKEIARVSPADAESYHDLMRFYGKIGPPISRFLNEVPADLVDPGSSDIWALFKRGFRLRRLGKEDMLEVLRLAPMPVYDWLDEWFESDVVKAALALPAVTESYSGPWSPGTNTNLLIRQVTRGRSVTGDGLALVSALEKAAERFGVFFEDGEAVRILPGQGVELENKGLFEAKTIMAACGPKKVFLEMMDPRRLSHKLEQRLLNFRTRGLTSQLLLAVDTVPSLEGGADRAIIADDLDAIEKAFDPVKYGSLSARPCLEIYIPTAMHPGLAPEGSAVVSVLIHYTPYDIEGGWTPDTRDMLAKIAIGMLEEKLPGLRRSIVGKELLTPRDIEERYGLSGGHLFEGEHALDQLLVRPTPECSRYKTPFEGLYLCSGGSFPGGGLTGAPGALAAEMALGNQDPTKRMRRGEE